MKLYVKLLTFILFNSMFVCSFGQFIKLDGRQFKDENGEDFYPMVMNYWVDLVYKGELQEPVENFDSIKLAPYMKFGSSPGYDIPSIEHGIGRIYTDFQEIKNLGFNVVRLVLNMEKDTLYTTDGFYFKLNKFDMLWYDSLNIPLKVHVYPPYDPVSDPNTKFFFDKYIELAKLADSVGLKLWIGCGGGWVIYSDQNINDYTNYLGAMANYIHGYSLHNLFCYEFYGEPSSSEKFYPPYPTWPNHTKPQICQIANKWDSTMKINDPDHLTTLGGTELNDPGLWDPTCLNVDFTNIHLYPDVRTFEWKTSSSPNGNDPDFLSHTFKRFKDLLYLYDQKFIKPYIFGETSFPGENIHNNHYMKYPYAVYGDEEDGRDFVEEMFSLVKNSKASGFQWWLFQNLHWAELNEDSIPSPKPNNYLNDVKECYLGLLRFGDPDSVTGYEGLRKLAAQKFIEYKTNPPAISPPDYGPLSPIMNMADPYYNPFNHPIENNAEVNDPQFPDKLYYGSITGIVRDQLEQPVVGAIVCGGSWVGDDPDEYNDTLKPEDLHTLYMYRTFTDSKGEFKLSANDYLPNSTGNVFQGIPHPELDSVIQYFTILAYGANESDETQYICHWYPVLKKDDVYHLNTLQSKIDVEIKDINIPIGQVRDFKGYSTLTATTVLVDGDSISTGGNSEIKATNEVTLKNGFWAIKGSEVNIFNVPVPIDCDDLNFSSGKKNICAVDIEKRNIQKGNEITVNFYNDKENSTIFPNPNHGNFTFILNSSPGDQVVVHSLTITNTFGSVLMERIFTGNQLQIQIPNPSPGVYFLNIRSNSKLNTFKFIVI